VSNTTLQSYFSKSECKQKQSRLQSILSNIGARIIGSSSEQRELRAFVIYTEETIAHAHRVRQRCADEWRRIQPSVEAIFDLVLLPKTAEAAHSALLNAGVGTNVACSDAVAVITLGDWEADVLTTYRKNSGVSFSLFSCLTTSFGRSEDDNSSRQNDCLIAATPASPDEYVAGVLSVKKDLKLVDLRTDSLTYSETFNKSIAGRADAFVAAFKAKGIKCLVRPWSLMTSGEPTNEYLQDVDAVVVLEGPSVIRHRDKLIKTCERENALLCTTELDSVFAGAALGCGVSLESFVPPLVSSLSNFVMGVRSDVMQQVTIPRQTGLRYNMRALQRQGVELSDEQRAALEMRSIYSSDVVDY
jgi:hypothetical protein